jgi:hypothetical protein
MKPIGLPFVCEWPLSRCKGNCLAGRARLEARNIATTRLGADVCTDEHCDHQSMLCVNDAEDLERDTHKGAIHSLPKPPHQSLAVHTPFCIVSPPS